MAHEHIRQDYFDAYQAQLTALTGFAEQLLHTYPEHLTIASDNISGLHIMAGGITAADMQAAFEYRGLDISHEEAIEMASEHSQAERAKAKARFVGLQTRSSMAYIVRQGEQGLLDETPEEGLLAYKSAEQHTVKPSEDLTVFITKLHEVEHLGEVAEYTLATNDELITRVLTVEVIAGKVVGADASVRPLEDESLIRWSYALGSTIGDLLQILAGRFEDNEELDNVLATVKSRSIGTELEDEISSILVEVRTRAIAAKAATKLSAQYSSTISLPSADTLHEWTDRISNL